MGSLDSNYGLNKTKKNDNTCHNDSPDHNINPKSAHMAQDPSDLLDDIAEAAARAAVPTLMNGALEGDMASVCRALELGADVNVQDPDGRSALMLAAFNGHEAVCGHLIAKGAIVDHRDTMGRTALMFAATGTCPDTIEALIQHGAGVNLVDGGEGWTPLMFAGAEGHVPVLEALLRHGAAKDTRDADGDTAHDFAAKNNHADAMALLVGPSTP